MFASKTIAYNFKNILLLFKGESFKCCLTV